jgi:DnaK suppressor protein
MATAAEARRIQRIRTLEAAQQRLDEGEFGFCTECGEFIGLKRLEIDAAAIRCIACAS